MIYNFVEKNKNKYTVEKMCNALKISKSSYYKSKKVLVCKNKNTLLKNLIKEIYYDNKMRYGSLKIKKSLERKGYFYSASWIARLMREMSLKSIVKRKYIATTNSNHNLPVYQNILNREFQPKELGKVWVSDITYIKVKEKWNYLTTIIDLADRQVISYCISDDLTAKNTIIKAWNKARQIREVKQGFMFHSDRGGQYASKEFTYILNQNKYISISMSRKANCWDNAVAESFFKTIKCEYINHQKFNNKQELIIGVFQYIHWYNNHRIHQSLNYLTPVEMEQYLLTKFAQYVA